MASSCAGSASSGRVRGRDRGELRYQRLDQLFLERAEAVAAMLAQHRGASARSARRRCRPGCGFGRSARPSTVSGSGSGSVLARRIFSAIVSASSVRLIRLWSDGSDFDIFLVPSRRLITRAARAQDQRLDAREELHAVIVVEFLRDVVREFEMLALVVAHRHARRVIGEDVGRHQVRIHIQPGRDASRSLPALSLNCVIRFSQPSRATQLKIQASRACACTADWWNRIVLLAGRCRRPAAMPPFRASARAALRVLPDGDRVQIHHAVDAVVARPAAPPNCAWRRDSCRGGRCRRAECRRKYVHGATSPGFSRRSTGCGFAPAAAQQGGELAPGRTPAAGCREPP